VILHTPTGTFVAHVTHNRELGFTYVGMHADNGTKCKKPCALVTHSGEADCAPEDQYCKRVGRKVAFARAIATFTKAIRAQLWAAYKETVKYQRPGRG
jgi:hypothetical protein